MSGDEAIEEVTTANVRGRGGGGFPAGIKWASGRKAKVHPKFIVCNSHEGEPNVYKDRHLHEADPHRILEGILIACIVCDAERGYNYIGGEHPLAIRRFRKAVADAGISARVLHVGGEVEDSEGLLAQRYDAAPGTVYLIRPDQHVAARWRGFDVAKIRAALRRATARQ